MKNRQRRILQGLIAISIVLILIAYVSDKIREYNKSKNLYNIGKAEKYIDYLDSPGIAIFDEFVFDQFNGVELNVDDFKLYRAESNIEGTNNFDAIERANRFLKSNSADEASLNDKESFDKLSNNILNNKFNDIKANYLSGINNDLKVYENVTTQLNNYIENNSLKFSDLGYLVNFYDGYESIYNFDGMNRIDFNKEFSNTINKVTKFSGLKYVDNKSYNILIYLENLNEIDKNLLDKPKLLINEKELSANLISTRSSGEGFILNYKLNEDIEMLLENRFVNSVKILKISTESYTIPSSAIVELDGVKGLYFIENNIIKFKPIKILEIKNSEETIIASDNNILPDSLKEDIKFDGINPFTNIILNPENYKNGDRY